MKYPISRRAWLRDTACGFGALGLASMLSAEDNPLAPRKLHFAPRAKRAIFLFMSGGPPHVDLFDPKPMLDRDHLKPLPFKMEQ